MNRCSKCLKSKEDSEFRWKWVTGQDEPFDGGYTTSLPHKVSKERICRECRSKRQRYLRRTPTVNDCVSQILAILDYRSVWPRSAEAEERSDAKH